jgi:hypothetical protein
MVLFSDIYTMKKIIYIFNAIFLLFFISCIENDLPYPKVDGSITVFMVEGQIGNAVINSTNRTVEVTISEETDMKKVKLLQLETSEGMEAVSVPETMNLLNPFTITLKSYQEYQWTIIGKQVIERYFTVENQAGKTVIDEENKSIKINVAKGQDLKNITVLSCKLGIPNSTISPDPFSVKDFSAPQIFSISHYDSTQKWEVEIINTDDYLAITDVNPWGKFVYVEGDYHIAMEKPVFEYKQKNSEKWNRLPEGEIIFDENIFKAKIIHLEPETDYVVRAVSNEMRSEEIAFTTEKTMQIPNAGFNDWLQHTRGIRKDWFPNSDSTVVNWWWDTGNRGANMFGDVNPTSPEESYVVSQKAAKLKPATVLGQFAAGNIYTGKFINATIVGGAGAELTMGKPFSSRPLALKGYYSYESGIIDKSKAPYTDLNGKQDSCHIYILLTDREEPYHIITNQNQFIDFGGEDIIAFAELIDGEGTNGEYKEFKLDLEYRDLNRKPKHIVVVASSCKYGDYFTGSTKSLLYIDEFELVY